MEHTLNIICYSLKFKFNTTSSIFPQALTIAEIESGRRRCLESLHLLSELKVSLGAVGLLKAPGELTPWAAGSEMSPSGCLSPCTGPLPTSWLFEGSTSFHLLESKLGMGTSATEVRNNTSTMCKNTDVLTLISYKIKEPNFTIQETDVLFAVISKIKCDWSSAP